MRVAVWCVLFGVVLCLLLAVDVGVIPFRVQGSGFRIQGNPGYSTSGLAGEARRLLQTGVPAAGSIQVNESLIRLMPFDTHGELKFSVTNSTGRPVRVTIECELLDPEDAATRRATIQTILDPGAQSIPVNLSLGKLFNGKPESLYLHRVRYRVTPEPKTVNAVSGVVAVSEITPDCFQLRVATPERLTSPGAYKVLVMAFHPITGKPVSDVQLVATIKITNQAQPATFSVPGTTDISGTAQLDFTFPQIHPDESATIEVTGTKQTFSESARSELKVDRVARIWLHTDKVMYQPGQTLHMRALVAEETGPPVSEITVEFEIKDPESTTIFHKEVTASRFGVAVADWTIPENQRLGDFEINAQLQSSGPRGSAIKLVKVSRYEIPTFRVQAETDRTFYLPGQVAVVDIKADYLFGQPVKNALVRVVREIEREWNFREQKYDVQEGETFTSRTDAQGHSQTTLDLSGTWEYLKAEKGDPDFGDISYSVYATDPITGRTEHCQFDVRVSKEPIHVYVFDRRDFQSRGGPYELYITTSTPDGLPTECEVEVYQQQLEPDAGEAGTTSVKSELVGTLSTSRYGVLKVSIPSSTYENIEVTFEIVARDRSGNTVKTTHTIWLYEPETGIQVRPEKTLYCPGETIKADLVASQKSSGWGLAVVAQKSKVVASKNIWFEQGKATIEFSYQPDFAGLLSLFALFPSGKLNQEEVIGQTALFFPTKHTLALTVKPGELVCKPGAKNTLDLKVSTKDGKPVESTLGVAIYDKAIEGRIPTGWRYGTWNGAFGKNGDTWGFDDAVGGWTFTDLENLDVSQPFPPELDTVAEILLNYSWPIDQAYWFFGYRTSESPNLQPIFHQNVLARLKTVFQIVSDYAEKNRTYPKTLADVERIFSSHGRKFSEITDPWGMPFQSEFVPVLGLDKWRIKSSGPDKKPGTDDDFLAGELGWSPFTKTGEVIDRVLRTYHQKTGEYIRDVETLRRELALEGINLSDLRDRWGHPLVCEFTIEEQWFCFYLKSAGEDGKLNPRSETHLPLDDFVVWESTISYFDDIRKVIDSVVRTSATMIEQAENKEVVFNQLLKTEGLDFDELRDPWGNAYQVKFEKRVPDEEEKRAAFEFGAPKLEFWTIKISSLGPDGPKETWDDFDLGLFSTLVSRENSAAGATVLSTGSGGVVIATVLDETDAVISGAKVELRSEWRGNIYTALTDGTGRVRFEDLAPGLYSATASADGFSSTRWVNISVQKSEIVFLKIYLEPGTEENAVAVTAGPRLKQTSPAEKVVKAKDPQPSRPLVQLSTPRLRKYFPETLLWEPLLETDQTGQVQLHFNLADNLTTWKINALASTMNGELVTGEAEITAFQPFFIEHDPPQVLTVGDELSLPVLLRNFLPDSQTMTVSLKPESWFELHGSSQKQVEVAANSNAKPVFSFRATQMVQHGPLQVTATNSHTGDAIEKSVTVLPDAQEQVQTVGKLADSTTTLELTAPEHPVPGTLKGEVKIYPNLIDHVFEGIDGIVQRPYGCAEQTISAAYANVLVLQYLKQTGALDSPTAEKARTLTQEGIDRLIAYRLENNAFAYWGSGDPNWSLTAYAVQFLSQASEFAAIDTYVLKQIQEALVKAQLPNGNWPMVYQWRNGTQDKQAAAQTACIVYSLVKAGVNTINQNAIAKGLAFVKPRIAASRDPYFLACYVLAASETGDMAGAQEVIPQLIQLAQRKGEKVYWEQSGPTLFYGWGTAGQIETTALVLQALVTISGANPPAEVESLINRGFQYLIETKDRYGVWYSTQASLNAWRALLVLARRETHTAQSNETPESAEVWVNGTLAKLVTWSASGKKPLSLTPDSRTLNPLSIDVSKWLIPGRNQIVLKRNQPGKILTLQAVVGSYVPWAVRSLAPAVTSPDVQIHVAFDKTEAMIGESVTCTVTAQRTGKNAYGMLLAEIGLPPGVDVDQASLETAVAKLGSWGNSFEVRPDQVILYLWPSSTGSSTLSFSFTPRFAMNAKAVRSILYDYYNPEAQTVIAPARFVIRER
ncbi:MAG: carboxypeptidase regulatory-like domain-containing protein [Acidobacteria bacterium]|nr:carboxypeptidase regulatory-like domain-containing protein [Acidobacteriota bacterium]